MNGFKSSALVSSQSKILSGLKAKTTCMPSSHVSIASSASAVTSLVLDLLTFVFPHESMTALIAWNGVIVDYCPCKWLKWRGGGLSVEMGIGGAPLYKRMTHLRPCLLWWYFMSQRLHLACHTDLLLAKFRKTFK